MRTGATPPAPLWFELHQIEVPRILWEDEDGRPSYVPNTYNYVETVTIARDEHGREWVVHWRR